MQFTYTPDGVAPEDAKVWEFTPGKLMSPEAEAIERLTGMTFAEWQRNLDRGSVVAFHALLYIFLKRADPTLRYEQVVFSMSEVVLDLDDREKADIVANLRAKDGPLTETEAALLEALAGDIGDIEVVPDDEAQVGDEGEHADDEGKAPGTDEG